MLMYCDETNLKTQFIEHCQHREQEFKNHVDIDNVKLDQEKYLYFNKVPGATNGSQQWVRITNI